MDQREQALQLAKRPHVVIATPGRLADHIKTSGEDTICGLRRVRFVVFDEADRLLAPGRGSMLPDMETCLSALPPPSQRQSLLFTATVTPEVLALKEQPRQGRPPIFVCEVDMETLAIPPKLQQKYLQAPVTHKECYLHVLLGTPGKVFPGLFNEQTLIGLQQISKSLSLFFATVPTLQHYSSTCCGY
jgi:ATP-dependent RNA helicase DDX49/DBP8